MKKLIYILIFNFLFTYFSVAVSADSSAAITNTYLNPDDIAQLAKKVERVAAQNQAKVIILGRVGRDPASLPRGIHYTHTAIGVYSMISTEDGGQSPGYAIYNLYQDSDDPDKSYLAVDFPFDFFSGVQSLKAGIIIPDRKLQERILEVIINKENELLHNPRYSVMANPNNTKFQNCTEHTLDIINAAIYQTTDIEKLKKISTEHFEPQTVHISGLKLVIGSIFIEGATTRDHTNGIKTATYMTIGNYLDKFGLIEKRIELTLDDV
ncbi:MAG: DUF2145 domain-containing protein [Pseudomonadota bacterium]